MELTIHHVKVSEFIKLKPVMNNIKEWKKNDKFYLSGHIMIRDLEITLFSEEYDHSLADFLKD